MAAKSAPAKPEHQRPYGQNAREREILRHVQTCADAEGLAPYQLASHLNQRSMLFRGQNQWSEDDVRWAFGSAVEAGETELSSKAKAKTKATEVG